MSDIEYNPIGWAKDSILTGEIAKILDSTEGSDYIYNISSGTWRLSVADAGKL